MQLSTEAILLLLSGDFKSDVEKFFALASNLLPPFLEVIYSLLIVVSACYITSWVRKSTGKKQNTYLLTLHIINLFFLTIAIANDAILYYKSSLSRH